MIKDIYAAATRASVLDALAHVLVNAQALIDASRVAEWNVIGFERSAFRDIARRQRLEMEEGLDAVAARMRILEGRPGIAAAPDPTCAFTPSADALCAAALAGALRDGHRELIDCLLAADDVARDADDGATSLLLTGRIGAHQMHLDEWSSCLCGGEQ